MAKIQPQFEEFHKTIKLDAKDKAFLIEKKEIIFCKVLAIVKIIGTMPDIDRTERLHTRAALSCEVNDLRRRVIVDLPPCEAGTAAKIRVFLIGEKIFIEKSDLLDNLAADHHTGPGNRLRFVGQIFIEIGHQIT